MLDGKEFQLVAGETHYVEYWRHQSIWLKNLGVMSVMLIVLYIFWNYHLYSINILLFQNLTQLCMILRLKTS